MEMNEFSRATLPSTLDRWMLAIYLGVSPIYALPYLDYETIRIGKMGLAFVAWGMVLYPYLRQYRIDLPKGILGPLGFITLFVFSIPGIAQSESLLVSVDFVMDIGWGALVLWTFYHLVRQRTNVEAVLIGALVILDRKSVV